MNQPGFNGMPCKGLVSRCSFVSRIVCFGDLIKLFGGKAPYVCGCRFLFKLKLKIDWINTQNPKESRKNSWTFMEKWSDLDTS